MVNLIVTGIILKVCVCSVMSNSATPWTVAPPGSSAYGIFQARMLEWVAISFSRVSSRPRDRSPVSCIAGRFLTVWATGKPFLILTEAQIVPSLAKELSSFSLSLTGFDVLLCAEHWGLPDVSCVFHAPQLETTIHTRNSASFSGILYFKTIIEAQKYSLWLGWPLFLFHFC